jgi:hypothetical protein
MALTNPITWVTGAPSTAQATLLKIAPMGLSAVSDAEQKYSMQLAATPLGDASSEDVLKMQILANQLSMVVGLVSSLIKERAETCKSTVQKF